MTPKNWTWTRCNGSLTRCATCTSTGPELWLFLLLVNMPTNLHFWLEWQLEDHPTQHFNTTSTTSKLIIWNLDYTLVFIKSTVSYCFLFGNFQSFFFIIHTLIFLVL